MRKYFLLVSAALMLTVTSCSNQKESSTPKLSDKADISNSSAFKDEDVKDDMILTIAVSGGDYDNVLKVIEQFNADDNGYRIKVKKYMDN